MGCGLRTFFGGEFHLALRVAKPQAGQGVDDHPMTLDAAQTVIPAIRRIAEDISQEALPVRALQLGFDFLREVRLALLEADVNFRVVKEFVARVKERAVGVEVLESVNAGQMVIRIVHEELTAILGAGDRTFRLAGSPAVVMLVGLQGSGKTTSAAKLAKHLVKKEGLRKPSLVAADLRRPAAIDQLEKRQIVQKRYVNWQELYPWFTATALGIWLLGMARTRIWNLRVT